LTHKTKKEKQNGITIVFGTLRARIIIIIIINDGQEKVSVVSPSFLFWSYPMCPVVKRVYFWNAFIFFHHLKKLA
jgi:hypothetical protein